MDTQKLELLNVLTKNWEGYINPKFTSIKFCQNKAMVFLEIKFDDFYSNPISINLDFISEDEDSDGTFPPYVDIVDNARLLLGFDVYNLNVCFESLFVKESVLIDDILSHLSKRTYK